MLNGRYPCAGLCLFSLTTLAIGYAQAPPPSLKTIYTFNGRPDAFPAGPLSVDSDGLFYGTSMFGGLAFGGTVFRLTPPSSPGGPWTKIELSAFTGKDSDGYGAASGLVIGPQKALYGTTFEGGNGSSPGCGTIYQLTPASPGVWTKRIIYAFSCQGDQPDGSWPNSVLMGTGGTLYGTTYSGGGAGACGVAFALQPPTLSGGQWTYTVLYTFTGTIGDGCNPFSGLTIGRNEVLYGTTAKGGDSNNGTIFHLLPPGSPGGAWTESVLYRFKGIPDGYYPQSAPVQAPDGTLFGVTPLGGTLGGGTVFELTPPPAPGGQWTEALIHEFGYDIEGTQPTALIRGSGGFLFGLTGAGGSSLKCYYGCGTAFELRPPNGAGGTWSFYQLHDFSLSDGATPFALIIGPGGLLYGTSVQGGPPCGFWHLGCGTLFELTP